MALHPDYPLPDVTHPTTKPFWDGCRAGKLMLQRERDTGIAHWPPKPAYWKGGTLEWFTASGHGTIYSYVVGYEPFLPVNCTPEKMAFGMPVRVVFKRLTEAVTLPVWEPAGAS
jgi:uncharacterized OB-fold protein